MQGVVIQLERQIEAYWGVWGGGRVNEWYLEKKELSLVKNNQKRANELPRGFVKALCWPRNSFCTEVVEREKTRT